MPAFDAVRIDPFSSTGWPRDARAGRARLDVPLSPVAGWMPTLTRNRLANVLEQCRGRRIVVVGDAMLDAYLHGDVDRISPEAPVPVVRIVQRVAALGGAANVAQNVAASGASCDLIAVVGEDEAGNRFRQLATAAGLATDLLVTADRCTTQKTRIVARAQQVVRIDEEDDSELNERLVAQILERVARAVDTADALVLEDYNKGVLTPHVIEEAIQCARSRGIPIVVDPKYKHFFRYGGATVFKPNRRELEAALGAALDLDHAETLPGVVARLNVENLLLTLGERGMVLVSGTSGVSRIPASARQVFDVVGAGDTVTAYVAVSLAAGADLMTAAVIANIAAGIEVGKAGAAIVTPEEILAEFDEALARDAGVIRAVS
jgi:rfaE bifunctional protein kinase chain/domain